MNRALNSAVSGLKAQQTAMDVIGNNIANVSTYGYKTQSTIFSDVMYQTMKEASGGTSSSGGVNASTVGYGTTVSSVKTDTSSGSTESTSDDMDVAITDGNGFFQVMDSSGNIYYTKVGSFQVDDNGYLTDSNGNFVLGSTGSGGTADSQKILCSSVGTVDAAYSTDTFTLNGKSFTMTASNATEDGDVSVKFASSTTMASGLAATATISSSGAITVTLNANYSFSSMDDLNDAINDAITEANGGTAIAAGDLTLTTTDSSLNSTSGWPLTGAELVGYDYSTTTGSLTMSGTVSLYGTDLDSSDLSVSSGFSSSGTVVVTSATSYGGSTTTTSDDYYTLTATVGGNTYTATVAYGDTSGTVAFFNTNGDTSDYFVTTNPGYSTLAAQSSTVLSSSVTIGTAVASEESSDVGLGAATITLAGGTAGGTVDMSEIDITIGSDGTVTASSDSLDTSVVVGTICLATFANASGLQQVGSSYFEATANSGDAEVYTPGDGSTGTLTTGVLEMSNVDLSTEMTDMITAQRGFQACSRVITVSDSMIEELVNLKRS